MEKYNKKKQAEELIWLYSELHRFKIRSLAVSEIAEKEQVSQKCIRDYFNGNVALPALAQQIIEQSKEILKRNLK